MTYTVPPPPFTKTNNDALFHLEICDKLIVRNTSNSRSGAETTHSPGNRGDRIENSKKSNDFLFFSGWKFVENQDKDVMDIFQI